MSSLDSANGPSVTVRVPPARVTRPPPAPTGMRPAKSTRAPERVASMPRAAMASMRDAGGGVSGCWLTLRVLTKRIVGLLGVSMEYAGRTGSPAGVGGPGVRVDAEQAQPGQRRDDAGRERRDAGPRTGRDRAEPTEQGDRGHDREGAPAPAALRRVPDRHDHHGHGEGEEADARGHEVQRPVQAGGRRRGHPDREARGRVGREDAREQDAQAEHRDEDGHGPATATAGEGAAQGHGEGERHEAGRDEVGGLDPPPVADRELAPGVPAKVEAVPGDGLGERDADVDRTGDDPVAGQRAGDAGAGVGARRGPGGVTGGGGEGSRVDVAGGGHDGCSFGWRAADVRAASPLPRTAPPGFDRPARTFFARRQSSRPTSARSAASTVLSSASAPRRSGSTSIRTASWKASAEDWTAPANSLGSPGTRSRPSSPGQVGVSG